ncbi:Phosphoribosyl-AMP cyclohydrolase [Gammaproteobacteria bacterium]
MSNHDKTFDASWLDEINWTRDGLVPVIVQDVASSEVLMFAWMNQQALALTLVEGYAVYWSRSRQRLWRKGEESGHTQRVLQIRLDCDKDAILIKVEQIGGITCHTGRRSCFFHQLEDDHWVVSDAVLKDPRVIYK